MMPNRIIREGILDSDEVDKLDVHAELFYRRLMSVVDDYGRFDARPAILRARCYPLRLDKVTEEDIKNYLKACHKLITIYTAKGKPYLQINNWKQQVRAKYSKYPAPEEQTSTPCEAYDIQPQTDEQHMDTIDEDEVGVDIRPNGLVDVTPTEPPAPKAKPVNFKEIVDRWNTFAKENGLSQVEIITDKRKNKIKTRLAENINFPAIEQKIKDSPFLRGDNNKQWKITFDWLIENDSNWVKVAEGQYDKKKPGGSRQNKQIQKQDYQEAF
jgi:hypothetical protein